MNALKIFILNFKQSSNLFLDYTKYHYYFILLVLDVYKLLESNKFD